jgi:hypothetical protein
LTNCALERELLNAESLVAQIKSNYRQWIKNAAQGRKIDADYFSALLASRTLKIQVLDELESELRSQLKSLDRRNAELAKILAIRRHNLN